jgi:maltose O-acetyltransferase
MVGGTNLRVGTSTFFNSGAWVETSAPVTIGSHVSFGPQVMICTWGLATPCRAPAHGLPVTIGDGVWVG